MPSHIRKQISLLTKLHLFYENAKNACLALVRTFAVRRQRPEWSFLQTLLVTFIQGLNLSGVSKSDMLSLIAPTGEALQQYCLDQKIALQSTEIDCGANTPSATLHTLTLSSSTAVKDRVIFYFHGGAFMYPLVPGPQMPAVRRVAEAVKASRIVVLEYTLAPASLYPTQMVQAVCAMKHLIEVQEAQPSDVVLYGESAGGNLVLSLLAHLKKPHPEAPPIDLGHCHFKAALLSSPWVSMSVDTQSFTDNATWDVFDANEVANFVATWQPKHEVWADMLEEDHVFWRDIPVQTMCIVAGERECFRDGIVAFADRVQATRYPDVSGRTLFVGRHETHCQAGADTVLGINDTKSMLAMLDAIEQRL